MSRQLFSKSEAEEKLGRSVETLRVCGLIPPRTRGKVVLTDKTPDGYEVAIEWELPADAILVSPRRSWLSKAEYEESLIEITPR